MRGGCELVYCMYTGELQLYTTACSSGRCFLVTQCLVSYSMACPQASDSDLDAEEVHESFQSYI